jgi:hypothetical protein
MAVAVTASKIFPQSEGTRLVVTRVVATVDYNVVLTKF